MSKIEISAIVPVTERFDDVEEVYRSYKAGVAATGKSFEFIYVLDGPYPDIQRALEGLISRGESIKVVALAKWFGEATAIGAGHANARGDIILTLPAYQQAKGEEIPRVVAALDGCHMAVARRFPRRDTGFNVFQSRIFHALLKGLMEQTFHDLGCGLRAIRREVLDEIGLYGEQHRFLPILAMRQGFRVVEIDVAQAEKDVFRRVYRHGVYIRRLLGVLTIFFLAKFTRKPLRFFGLIGATATVTGSLGMAYLLIDKLVFGAALADRPALILATLLFVLGIQIIAVGLVGELIIFINARSKKEYTVESVIN